MSEQTYPDPRFDADRAIQKVCDGIVRFRAVVRAQPITVAMVMLGFGYLLGHLAMPRRR